jgi:hypothetical protein
MPFTSTTAVRGTAMFRRSRLARVALTLTVLSPLAAALAWPRRSRPDLSNWDETRLTRELESFGYRCHKVEADVRVEWGGRSLVQYAGLWAARADDPRPWEEIVSRCCGAPERLWAGQGLVVVKRRHGGAAAPADPEYLEAGPFTFFGDPVELDRIAGRLGLTR